MHKYCTCKSLPVLTFYLFIMCLFVCLCSDGGAGGPAPAEYGPGQRQRTVGAGE